MSLSRKMRRLPLRDIRLTDRFWSNWQRVLREVTIEAEYQQLVETGRLQNFLKAATADGIGRRADAAPCDQSGDSNPDQADHAGYFFNDSDVYKWCEAAAYAQANYQDETIRLRIEEVVSLI